MLVRLCIFAIFPVVWMVLTAFKQNRDLYNPSHNPFLFNLPPTLTHLKYLFTQTDDTIFLWNSFFIGVIVMAITLVLAVPAAYSLARLMGHWGERSGIAIFLVYLIPPTLPFIPLYEIVTRLGTANTVWSLVLDHRAVLYLAAAQLLPFGAAGGRRGGADRSLEPHRRLLAGRLPLAVPGIATCVVFAFALSLSDYIYAAVFVTSTTNRTVSAGVPTALIRGDIYYWQELMAATAIVGIPLAVVYGLLFDWPVKGFQADVSKPARPYDHRSPQPRRLGQAVLPDPE